MIKKIIAIKNNKIQVPECFVIKGKKSKNVMGYLLKVTCHTSRTNHSYNGNHWDMWVLISKKPIKYCLGEKKT